MCKLTSNISLLWHRQKEKKNIFNMTFVRILYLLTFLDHDCNAYYMAYEMKRLSLNIKRIFFFFLIHMYCTLCTCSTKTIRKKSELRKYTIYLSVLICTLCIHYITLHKRTWINFMLHILVAICIRVAWKLKMNFLLLVLRYWNFTRITDDFYWITS